MCFELGPVTCGYMLRGTHIDFSSIHVLVKSRMQFSQEIHLEVDALFNRCGTVGASNEFQFSLTFSVKRKYNYNYVLQL
jgi:hypothetical protein